MVGGRWSATRHRGSAILSDVRRLCLRGGGASGLAFHAGVLWALHHDLGWDPADIIVGTSAGSIVGALLRSNVAPEDLAAWATKTDPSTNGHEFRAVMDFTDSIVTRLAVPRLTALGWHMLNLVRHPSQLPGAMATMLPNGLHDHSPRAAILDRFVETWPSNPLWIPAVRLGEGLNMMNQARTASVMLHAFLGATARLDALSTAAFEATDSRRLQ